MAEASGSSPQVRGTSLVALLGEHAVGLIPAGAGNIAARTSTNRASQAHPRRCGEHTEPQVEIRGTSGSSPQVRGTFRQAGAVLLEGGLIPAGAGNMRCRASRRRSGRAHPRRCGEHSQSCQSTWRLLGSSPQVRGTWVQGAYGRDLGGLIPAGAGNMAGLAFVFCGGGAHPRRCGEHPWLGRGFRCSWGSSPQVRGT